MSYGYVPEELKAKNQWVNVWNTSKTPMRVDRCKAASPSDPSTWGCYEDALFNVDHGHYDGLGFVFNGDYVAVDLDDAFTDSGRLTPQALSVVLSCKSYTEISRSGKGLHILLKGTLPFDGFNNRQGFEIYKTKRFFVITGDAMMYTDIATNQIAIDNMVDKYCHYSLIKNHNDVTFKKIYTVSTKIINGKLVTEYPTINQGSRNVSLLSYGGQLLNQGLSWDVVEAEVRRINQKVCVPPLAESEVKSILKSIRRYA